MNEIKVLGLSGKKQSGKNTSGNYVVGVFLKALKITEDFHISEKGNLIISDIWGNEQFKGVLDMNSKHPEFLEFAEENIFPFVKLYSYADLLKQHVCMDILGLTYEQCYGSDEQKNTETHLFWEDMPEVDNRIGPMTAREVMQFQGTEIFRKMYDNVWVDATLRQIQKDAPIMAIITDVRFPNEVDGITNAKEPLSGAVYRFTRDVFKGQDQHTSETSLDDYPWEKSQIIANDQLTVDEQNEVLHQILADRQWLPHEIPAELLERITAE